MTSGVQSPLPNVLEMIRVPLFDRFIGSGRVTFLAGSEYRADGASDLVTSLVSGETTQVEVR